MKSIKKNSGCQVSTCDKFTVKLVTVKRLSPDGSFSYPAFYCLCDEHAVSIQDVYEVTNVENVEPSECLHY